MELGESIDIESLADKRKTCLQMAQGVSQLHQLGFFHRDLKIENFVIGKYNKIKLIDYGVAKTITLNSHTPKQGTYQYMAPEVSKYSHYDSSVDIWSLGVIFYELFTSTTFFDTSKGIFELRDQCVQISQQQINNKLKEQEKNNRIKVWQKKLLENMIMQRLDKSGKLDNFSKKRIGLEQVINELEQNNDLKQNQFQQLKEDIYEILAFITEIKLTKEKRTKVKIKVAKVKNIGAKRKNKETKQKRKGTKGKQRRSKGKKQRRAY